MNDVDDNSNGQLGFDSLSNIDSQNNLYDESIINETN